MAIFYEAVYLLDGKLHGESALRDRYGYALLGVMPRPQGKGLLAGADRFFDKLAGIQSCSEEESCQRIALNVTNLAEGQEKILLTGTVPLEKLQAADGVSKQLEGIVLVPAADITLHTGTLEVLTGCGAVLLAEEEGKSRVSGIRKEHECIAALDKPVMGYVLL